jgi:hypothetical protein
MAYTPDVSMFPYFGNHRDIGELEDLLDEEMLKNERLIRKSNASILRRKKLEKENKKLKDQNDYLWEPVNADDYIRLDRQYEELKAKYENTNIDNRRAWAKIRGLKDIIENKERQIDKLKESL